MTIELDTYTQDRVNLVSPEEVRVISQTPQFGSTAVSDYQTAARRVMIADDFAMTRHFLRAAVERSPAYEVVGMVDNGPGAIRMAAAVRPDVVLLDMLMPGVQGTSALSGIRRAVTGASVVVVSSIDPALETSLLEAGATGFVSKQTAPLDFLDRLEQILGSVGSRDAGANQAATLTTAKPFFEPKRLDGTGSSSLWP